MTNVCNERCHWQAYLNYLQSRLLVSDISVTTLKSQKSFDEPFPYRFHQCAKRIFLSDLVVAMALSLTYSLFCFFKPFCRNRKLSSMTTCQVTYSVVDDDFRQTDRITVRSVWLTFNIGTADGLVNRWENSAWEVPLNMEFEAIKLLYWWFVLVCCFDSNCVALTFTTFLNVIRVFPDPASEW